METAFLLLILVAALAAYVYFQSPTVKGAKGEARVASRLASALPPEDYVILNDLTLPTRDGTTQIDHVVISRFGIFVIETKNMNGWIFGGENQARWTQTFRRHKSSFQNPLRQNFKHVKAVQEHLSMRARDIHNVVAFVGSATPRTTMPENVLWSVRELVDYIRSRPIPVFSEGRLRPLQTDYARSHWTETEQRKPHTSRISGNRAAKGKPTG